MPKKRAKSIPKIKHSAKPVKQMRLRPAVVIAGVAIALLLVALLAIRFMPRQASLPQQTAGDAAIVNGELISLAEIDRLYSHVPESYRLLITKTSILNRTIEEKLILQYAAKTGMLPNESAVDEAVMAQINSANLTLEQAVERLAKNNYTLEDLKHQIRRDMAIENIVNKTIMPAVIVGPEELRQYYDDNNLSTRNVSFESIKPQIEAQLRNTKIQNSFDLMLKQLWATATVTVLMPAEASQ